MLAAVTVTELLTRAWWMRAVRLGAPLVTCLMALAAAASAGATPAWIAPKMLAPGPSASSARLALDPRGDAVVVWQQFVGTVWEVQASSRPAGGTWTTPATLSNPAESSQSPDVALGADGRAVAVWERAGGGTYAPEAAIGDIATSNWQSRRSLTGESSPTPVFPRVAVNATGEAAGVWERSTGGAGTVEASILASGAPSWAPAHVLSETGEAMHAPAVGIAAGGVAVAVWEQREGLHVVIDAARRQGGASGWEPAVRISGPSEERNANEPGVAVDERGNAVAIWEKLDEVENIEAASLPAGGAGWAPPVRISTRVGSYEPGSQEVTIDGQGRASVVWQRESVNRIEATTQHADGSWETPVVISPAGEPSSEPDVAAGAGGGIVAVWAGESAGKMILQFASRPAGASAWSAAANLPAEAKAEQPRVAVDGQGDALASWTHYTGSYSVEAAAYDAAGPLLEAVSIPAVASPGQTLAFSVSPLDVWSALAPVGWSFGDGTTAAGQAVTHSFAASGTYHVTVTSADVLGNTSSASGSVAVTEPPRLAISGLTQSRARWREGKALAWLSRTRALPVGTVFSFALNLPARVEFRFSQVVAGRYVKGHCVLSRRSNAKRPRCPLNVVRGHLAVAGKAGLNRLSFQGRVSPSARLAPGGYSLAVTATAASGSARAHALAFSIAR